MVVLGDLLPGNGFPLGARKSMCFLERWISQSTSSKVLLSVMSHTQSVWVQQSLTMDARADKSVGCSGGSWKA